MKKDLIFKKILFFSVFLLWGTVSFAAAEISGQRPEDLQQKVHELEKFLAENQQKPKVITQIPKVSSGRSDDLLKYYQPAKQVEKQVVSPKKPPVLPTTVVSPATTPADTEAPAIYDEAFSKTVDQLLPMTPEQIARLKSAFNDSQRAAALPVGVPPRPTSSSVQVDLAPQAAPPVIRLQAGYITSLVFMDSTGQPWPVAAYSLGDPAAFNIQWDKKSNTLLVQAMTFYKRTNLAVLLRGLNTPVMMTFLTGQEAVDYRVDLRVPGLGPNAAFEQEGLPGGANPILLDVLNGIPPRNSKTLRPSRSDCQAWFLGKTLFLRTSLDIVSPAWRSKMTSIDGTHAYELQPTPVILALEHGKDKTITLTLEGWE